MSAIYDNWERLVAAVLKKKQLWELFNQPPSPSNRSGASSSSSSSFNVSDLGSDFLCSSKWQKSYPSLVRVSDFSPRIDIKDASRASSVLLGRGTFGSAYTATIDDCARIVVKRLKSATVSHVDFKRCMEIVGDVRHENVVGLRAYYSFEDQRLVIYDYYEKGSMYSLLHGQRNENRAHVDWETRLRIAIGAARGIAAINKELRGMLVHGNIKASNVFLNSDLYGCVSDLGLASMIKTTFDSTAQCYAPEVKNTQNISQASDVYGFGILLLELLTRLPSVHVPGGPAAVDLVKLLNSVKSRERAAKVFDADLLMRRSINEQMVKVLQIGIQCVAKSIKK
ncbi:hypothetical protein ACS0TY_015712 [Phlomoides rotata]